MTAVSAPSMNSAISCGANRNTSPDSASPKQTDAAAAVRMPWRMRARWPAP